jgi:large subunit ribosomal protein L21
MFAVVKIAGSQVEVSPNAKVDVPFLNGNPGDVLEFSDILLFEDNGTTKVGTPLIKGTVSAKILEHFRADKLIVFKKRRRKGYRKLNGHRQAYTKIEITNIKI